MRNRYRHIFGPVPSRRLGLSLGVDLTPYKTCTLNCVFCQLGRTPHPTVHRDAYVSMNAVLSELERWLHTDGDADHITLSGAGEPTLHSDFREVLQFVHDQSTIPTVLLTNGTLLHIPEVREAARYADIVKVSLSAWDQASYEQVNRPHPNMTFDQLIEGQKTFRSQFNGRFWLEVFLIDGLNSTPADVRKIAALAASIAPDRIHLNTAVRPPAEEFVTALSHAQLASRTHLFQPAASIIAEFKGDSKTLLANEDSLLAMLQRRPCTLEQIAAVFGMHRNEATKYVGRLIRSRRVRAEHRQATVYYVAVTHHCQDGAEIS